MFLLGEIYLTSLGIYLIFTPGVRRPFLVIFNECSFGIMNFIFSYLHTIANSNLHTIALL